MIFNRLSRNYILVVMTASALLSVVVLCLYSALCTNFGDALRDCSRSVVNTSNSTLELVHIVFRHGPRTPVDTYPNDPYINDSFYPTGWGHVTNRGKVELLDMGIWLNKRYGEFMGPYYSPDRVHAQATASPRALMSLSTVLATFFAPKHTPMEFSKNLNWQPIPIFSEPLDQDSLLLVRTPCPRYFEAREEVFQMPEVKAELAQYEPLFRNLTLLTGMRVATAEDVNSIYITLQAEKYFGLPLPHWTADYFPKKMQFLTEQSYVYNAYTREMQKLKGGPFLKKMYAEMMDKRKETLVPRDRKLFIYTGHDWTVGNILSALQVWERQLPLFSIMAMFELHRNLQTKEYYVEIFLRNDEQGCIKQLQVPGCDLKCPLDRLIELSHDVLPNEPYEQRCKPRNYDFVEPPPRPVDRNNVN